MNPSSLTIMLGLIISLSACKVIKYPLPDITLTSKQVCGQELCKPGSAGTLLHFTKNPYSPNIEENSSAKDIAYAVLGHTVASGDFTGNQFNTCSFTSQNPFTINDVKNIRFREGRDVQYTRSEKLNINVQAATESNIKELMKITSDSLKLKRLEAKIKAAYSRVNGKDLKVVGRYSEWGLSDDALEKIKKGDYFPDCRAYLEKNNHRIITAIGMVYFDIIYDENSLDSIATEIDSELKREGLQGSIAFNFKREVSKNLKATSNGVFQILIWRHAGIKPGSFVFN